MDLIPAVISGTGAIVAAVVVKVIADDAKEWTPWVTRQLLNAAVRRLPEGQQERYAEEWAAHLAEVPGVIAKLVVSLQFQIAAFSARELDARARLEAWQSEQAAVLAEIRTTAERVLASVKMCEPPNEADEFALSEQTSRMQGVLKEVIRRCDQIDAKRPTLGVTWAGATLLADRMFNASSVKAAGILFGRPKYWSFFR